jgi:hypothetical protein
LNSLNGRDLSAGIKDHFGMFFGDHFATPG